MSGMLQVQRRRPRLSGTPSRFAKPVVELRRLYDIPIRPADPAEPAHRPHKDRSSRSPDDASHPTPSGRRVIAAISSCILTRDHVAGDPRRRRKLRHRWSREDPRRPTASRVSACPGHDIIGPPCRKRARICSLPGMRISSCSAPVGMPATVSCRSRTETFGQIPMPAEARQVEPGTFSAETAPAAPPARFPRRWPKAPDRLQTVHQITG